MGDKYENDSASKYKWNTLVFIKKGAPQKFHPGEVGVVCGMSKIEFEEIAIKYHSKIGNWIYTIELQDGSDIQVADTYLEKYL